MPMSKAGKEAQKKYKSKPEVKAKLARLAKIRYAEDEEYRKAQDENSKHYRSGHLAYFKAYAKKYYLKHKDKIKSRQKERKLNKSLNEG